MVAEPCRLRLLAKSKQKVFGRPSDDDHREVNICEGLVFSGAMKRWPRRLVASDVSLCALQQRHDCAHSDSHAAILVRRNSCPFCRTTLASQRRFWRDNGVISRRDRCDPKCEVGGRISSRDP